MKSHAKLLPGRPVLQKSDHLRAVPLAQEKRMPGKWSEMRKEEAGEYGMLSRLTSLSITLGRCAAAVVRQLSFRVWMG